MIKLFKIVAILEGFSYLFLFANMFITKNMDFELYKKILYPLGLVHGLLFVAYIFLAIVVKYLIKWDFKTFFIVCIASLIPFGTFFIEKKYIKNETI
jgi:integral membrane protein